MESAPELQQQTRAVEGREKNPDTDSSITNRLTGTASKHYRWWIRVSVYILFLLAGQSAATLLGRLYYDKGGNSKWMATFVQSSGFPILIPLLYFFSLPPNSATTAAAKPPPTSTLASLYLFFGLLLTGDNLMYSYGLLYLPVSTYSLLCATQLAFNALFAFFLNSQKITALILNSLVLLTISAALLAVHLDSDDTTNIPKAKYAIGFFCTLGASATYSLYLSLIQLSFQKVIKNETFRSVLDMQICPSFVATCGCVVGLFASGEWRVSSVGLLGLIFEVSSLFSNVISTLPLPAVPILAVVFFRDKMDGLKVIAMLLAIWGSVSYIYQHYLDDSKAIRSSSDNGSSGAGVELC
ncbi:Purine permease 11 [Actinidia chinensis var. chinensis]|uniref:Probable purine permease n=1 Tax=Actinidia chinensis var. chinensis TaxID=1590841 RepID=A0A2R6PMG2_ACTCC|nr:Purine permease 11 [Actinidia chinensis var. chinensis]